MVQDLGQADKAEAHAQAKQAAAAGNVGYPAHLFRLAEPLRVRLLDEDVDDGQVLPGVLVHVVLDGQGQSLVGYPLPPPPVGSRDVR